MRKCLFLAVIILSGLSARAQSETDSLVTLAKVNYVGITEFLGWANFSDDEPMDKVEVHPDGIAITNTNLQSQAWMPQVMVVPEGSFDLEQGHDYIVRLTVKVPSDGTYMVNIGTWETNHVAYAPVKESDEFQIIDVEYPEYQGVVKGGHVLFGCGWVKGTTILKEVEVLEKTSTAGIRNAKPNKDADDTIYNLSGQRSDASYKGVVIQNGKKRIAR